MKTVLEGSTREYRRGMRRWLGVAGLALGALLGVRGAQAAWVPSITYTVYDVATGLPPGTVYSDIWANGLNLSGTVVGGIKINGQAHAYASTTSIEMLGELPNSTFVEARDINDSGRIVGSDHAGGNSISAARWPAGAHGSPPEFPPYVSPFVPYDAIAVNNAGRAAMNGTNSLYFNQPMPGWWGAITPFSPVVSPFLDGNAAFFTGINDVTDFPAGTATVGYILPYSFPGVRYAIKLQGGGYGTFLTVPGNVPLASSLPTQALGVNDAGKVVGTKELADGSLRAVRWSKTGVDTDLPPLPGGDECTALDINNHGRSVGESTDSDGNLRAVVWYGTQVVDLNTRIPASSGWLLETATAVNDAGQICGNGTFNGQPAAWRLDPDPGSSFANVSVMLTEPVGPAKAAIPRAPQRNRLVGGDPVSIHVTVQNAGPMEATNVMLTDMLPAGMTNVRSMPEGRLTGRSLSIPLGMLGEDETIDITITGTLPNVARNTLLTHTARVSGGPEDPEPENNRVSESFLVSPRSVDLSVSGSATPKVKVGQKITYTFRVMNNGPDDGKAGTLLVKLGTGQVTFFSASPNPTSQDGDKLTYKLGALPQGAVRTFTVIGKAKMATPKAEVTAKVDGPAEDLDADNNSYTGVTTINQG